MCNAWNHSEGCDCGFGPPYLDTVSFGSATEWAEETLDNPGLFRRGLHELAYDESTIERMASECSQDAVLQLPRATRIERIKEIVHLRKLETEKEWLETVKVPLYRFGGPGVAGSEVSYREDETKSSVVGWKVRLLGVGTGDSRDLFVSRVGQYTARGCERIQVFVPVPLRIRRVVIRERGRLVAQGVRAEVDAPKKKRDRVLRGRGYDSLPEDSPLQPQECEAVERFEKLLSGAKGVAPVLCERAWGLNVIREVELFLTSKGINIQPLARIRRQKVLTIKFSLPTGNDYLAWLWRGGLWWERPMGDQYPLALTHLVVFSHMRPSWRAGGWG